MTTVVIYVILARIAREYLTFLGRHLRARHPNNGRWHSAVFIHTAVPHAVLLFLILSQFECSPKGRAFNVFSVGSCQQRLRFQPKRTGRGTWFNSGGCLPCGFIAAAMDLAMIATAQRDGELVADLASERAAFGKAQVVGIRRLPAANQTGMLGHVADVIPVTNPAGLRQCHCVLIDRSGPWPPL